MKEWKAEGHPTISSKLYDGHFYLSLEGKSKKKYYPLIQLNGKCQYP